MSNFNQFISAASKPPTELLRGIYTSTNFFGINTALSANTGSLTATNLSPIVTLSGSGVIEFVGVKTADSTSRTLRLVITLDGIDIYDKVSTAIASASYGVIAVGSYDSNTYTINRQPLTFNNSLVISVASSLTETDKSVVYYMGYLT